MHCIISLEVHSAIDCNALNQVVHRTLAHMHLVKRSEFKTWSSIYYKAILQREAINLSDCISALDRFWIVESAIDVNLRCRSDICQATGLQNEVFESSILGKLINTREIDLATDLQSLLTTHLVHRRNEQNIFLAQFHIGRCSIQNTLNVHGKHLKASVGLATMHYRTCKESILTQSVGCLNQVENSIDTATHLVESRMEHSTLDLNHIRESWDY